MDSIGDILRMYREKAGISQRELGRRIDMSGQMISKIEKNETNPSGETILKIATELNISKDIINSYTDQILTNKFIDSIRKYYANFGIEVVKNVRDATIDELYDDGPVFKSFDEYKNNISEYWRDVVTWYPLDEFNEVDLNKLEDEQMDEIAKALEFTFKLKIAEIKNKK
jgi:transcriptional regulator with XRE-family HTH domain